jgi:hypothetical protein
MGVDVRVKLPTNVKIDNVAKVMGAYAGCPTSKSFFDRDPKDGWSTKVSGVEVKTTSMPAMAEIRLTGTLFDGETEHFCFYHFEPSEGEGRLMMPRSTAFWIALMTKVVDFFGGAMEYNDCESDGDDYVVPAKTWQENSPEDGEEWYNLQNRILNIVPVTKEEWRAANEHAAYKIGE